MEKDLGLASQVIEEGGIILYPTDTVWGLGCDVTNPEAIQKIIDLKKRPTQKSFIILISSFDVIGFDNVTDQILELANSERPTTVIVPNPRNLDPAVLAVDGSVGVRIPRDEFCKQLLKRCSGALVSTSSNESGEPAPAIYSEIKKPILDGVDYIVNWRQDDNKRSEPSRIVKVNEENEIEILRK